MCCPAHLSNSSKLIKSYLSYRRVTRSEECVAFQGMASANVKTLLQTSLLHIESSLDSLRLLSPTHGQRFQQQSGLIALQSVLINKPKFFMAKRHAEIGKIEVPRSMAMKALRWQSRRASEYPYVQSHAFLKERPLNFVRSRLLVDFRRKKRDRGQTSTSSQKAPSLRL